MKTCHVCALGCDDNAELCPNCGAELKGAEELEQIAEQEAAVLENPVLAVEVEDVITAEVYRDVLKENGIPFTCDSAEDDGSMKVLFGGGFVTEDIYVDADNLEKAKELYEQTLSMLESEEFAEDFSDENADIYENNTENE